MTNQFTLIFRWTFPDFANAIHTDLKKFVFPQVVTSFVSVHHKVSECFVGILTNAEHIDFVGSLATVEYNLQMHRRDIIFRRGMLLPLWKP